MGLYRKLPNDDFSGLSSSPCIVNVVKYIGWDPQAAAHVGRKMCTVLEVTL